MKGDGKPPSGGDDEEIGYCKPPRRTQFPPGKSGNPAGRPPRALGKHRQLVAAMDQPTREIFLTEMNRPVTVSGDGRKVRMPTKQMIIRSMAKTAAGGGQQAQRTALMLQLELERELAAERAEVMKIARWYKEEIGGHVERRRRLGLPEVPLIPHPDDVFIDEENQIVEVRGPWTLEQKAVLEKFIAMRDGYQRGVIGHQEAARTKRRDYTLLILAAMAQQRFDLINDRLPDRYRTKLIMRMDRAQIDASREKFRKGDAAAERRRAARRKATRVRKPPP